MRYLERLPKPQILIDKEVVWTDSFVNSDKKRPDNTKYGHLSIRTELHRISYKKCFYSEVKFAIETEGQIDHYIEIYEDKKLAFNWDNLYLSHSNCNQGKPSNLIIPVAETLNPFEHTDDFIENHLTFEDECITAKNNSILGLKTIQKYKLDSGLFDELRAKKLIQFYKILDKIKSNQISENREINDNEKNALFSFSQPDHSFSLMFRLLLKKHNL